jgi:heme/copper-type cytochrome/quinol oxidase subunit 4
MLDVLCDSYPMFMIVCHLCIRSFSSRSLSFLCLWYQWWSLFVSGTVVIETSVNAEAAALLGDYVTDDEAALTVASDAALVKTSQVAESMGIMWYPPEVRALAQRRLQAVTCDGETILVTLPVDHRISANIESAALAITILGAFIVCLILCFLYFFHLRSAIKASSPLFLLATLTGLLMLFISGTFLMHASPTDVSCGAGWWLANLGFTLTFGPLFVKCWRIYKIFMRKEMTVVRLTDANLFIRLSIALAIEIVS